MKMLSVPLVISLLETWHPVLRKRQILACYCMLLIVLSRDTIIIIRPPDTDVVVLAISFTSAGFQGIVDIIWNRKTLQVYCYP